MEAKLYQAVASGDYSFFESSFTPANSAILFHVTNQKNTLLHVAAQFKQKQIAKKLITLAPSLLYCTNSDCDTALHVSAQVGCLDITQLLIDCENAKYCNEDPEVEVNLKLVKMVNHKKDTALHCAVYNGHLDVVKVLIEEDPQLNNFTNCAGESPLFVAVDRKFFNVANYIVLQAPQEFSYKGRNNMNVLHAAVIRTHQAFQYNSFKDILVRIAVICTSRLLEFAACKFGKIWDKTYSEEASAEDFIINVIRRYPSAMEEADDFGWIPLHNAAHMGHTRAVGLFLSARSSLAYMKDKEGTSALHLAAREGHVRVMKELLTMCPDSCELQDNRGRSALHFAVDSGNTSVVDYILRTRILDCTINKQDNEGNTPFHLAAGKGNYTVLLMLAKDSRVDKGATNKRGLAAIDIINSKMDLRHYKKSWIGQKLEMAGGQPSLESIHYKRLGQLKMTVANYEAENITVANGGGNTAEVNEKKSVLTNGNSEEAEINFMYERFKDISNISILTATIIATVTFAAGFTMPSGYKNEDGTGQSMAVLSRRVAIIAFVIANTLAFCCSTASLLIHFWASLEKHHGTNVYFIKRARTFTYCSIISMVAAFISGTNVVLDGSSGLAIASLVICCSFLVAQSFLVLK